MAGLTQREIGKLQCFEYSPEQPPKLLVILCHGFGAPGEDLVPLGGYLLREYPQLRGAVQFVFPAAPLDLAPAGMPGGRAWWMLDMLKLQRAIELGEFRDLRREIPAGLSDAREMLLETIRVLLNETGLDWSQVVLGGFSQGSMLATEVALHAPEQPAGLIVWSGTLLAEEQWRELMPQRSGMSVFQSHGTVDSILPFQAAEWLRDLFVESGCSTEFVKFHDGHTIPAEALAGAANVVAGALENSPG
ncbi:MAG: hypothetical protein KDA88_20235 [Planctomycetaceae bacterium]|nr:hypothetical protein [Planctomycetaceae bacterium]MCB9953282.1 phospholipase [Planctomycetaceae bacterium]